MTYVLRTHTKYLRVTLFVATLGASCIGMGANPAIGIAENISPTTPSNTSSSILPNAYELVKELNAQKSETARLAGDVENLQMQFNNLKQQIKLDIKQELSTEFERLLQDRVKEEVDQALSKSGGSTRPPYLLPPKDDATELGSTKIDSSLKPSLNATGNPLTQPSTKKQGELAYAAAYAALKNEGVNSGIQKMQTFIATYANHNLIPNAHYWLGEFYLKQTPPNVSLAKEQFLKVVNDYKDHPSNDKQSKALYRLATFAKSSGKASQARQYIATLESDYPNSNEAKLAKSVKW